MLRPRGGRAVEGAARGDGVALRQLGDAGAGRGHGGGEDALALGGQAGLGLGGVGAGALGYFCGSEFC